MNSAAVDITIGILVSAIYTAGFIIGVILISTKDDDDD